VSPCALQVFILCALSVLFTDWILPVAGNEFKVKCKYCDRVLNARYLQLLRHSLSNKHLSSAAAAATLSLPMDVDSCASVDGSSMHAGLSEDAQMITDVGDEDDSSVLATEPDDMQLKTSDILDDLLADETGVSFIADTDTGHVDGRKKVGFCL